MSRIFAISLFIALGASSAIADDMDDFRSASPKGAAAYIISPADGETVRSPVTVKFGLTGMGVAPAGVEKENTGHHHLLINRALPPMDESMPAESDLIHLGGGQTETTVNLEPGMHTLQIILGDQNHIPHNPPIISPVITITVIE